LFSRRESCKSENINVFMGLKVEMSLSFDIRVHRLALSRFRDYNYSHSIILEVFTMRLLIFQLMCEEFRGHSLDFWNIANTHFSGPGRRLNR
jgi:hypothetical protein